MSLLMNCCEVDRYDASLQHLFNVNESSAFQNTLSTKMVIFFFRECEHFSLPASLMKNMDIYDSH